MSSIQIQSLAFPIHTLSADSPMSTLAVVCHRCRGVARMFGTGVLHRMVHALGRQPHCRGEKTLVAPGVKWPSTKPRDEELAVIEVPFETSEKPKKLWLFNVVYIMLFVVLVYLWSIKNHGLRYEINPCWFSCQRQTSGTSRLKHLKTKIFGCLVKMFQ